MTALPAGQRFWSSHLILGLLFATIVASLFLVIRIAATEPPENLIIGNAVCAFVSSESISVSDAARPHLPFNERLVDARQLSCRFALDLPDERTRHVALLIPSLSDAVTVSINGQKLGTVEVQLMRNLFVSTLPVFVPGLDVALMPGINQFQITASAQPGRMLTLDKIIVGDSEKVLAYYQSIWLLTAIIPTIVVGSEIALAIIFGLIWLARPHEREFGWLAVMMTLAALRGSVIIPDFGLSSTDRSVWNGLVVWEAFAGLMFSAALTRTPIGRWSLLLPIPPLLFTAIYSFGPIAQVVQPLILSGIGIVVIYLTAAVWMQVRSVSRGSRDILIVMSGMIVLLAFVTYDVFNIMNADTSSVVLARSIYGCFLITIAALMTFRFVRAMTDLDNMTAALNLRVKEVEEQLSATYEELHHRREAEVIERERSRIMRDLHDGIGGNLASILALADIEQPIPKDIARHARAALTDMRMIISSLEDYGGDLALALGTWRERAGPQFRAFNLTLIWQVRDMPPLTGMGPAHVLDILRIVQESVTNVIKHANASHVWIKTTTNSEGICLSIKDNGSDFTPAQSGNGIANMHARANRLGAKLKIERREDITCVLLILPQNLGERRSECPTRIS